MKWTVETLNEKVDKELEALPADMRARFIRIAHMIEQAAQGNHYRIEARDGDIE